jgi:hypothetical protein
MTPQLNELELLLAASRVLRDRFEAEAADLLLGCRVRFAADPAGSRTDGFEHVVATLYAPTSVLRRIAADDDVRARLRQALDAVQPQSVCVDGLDLRHAAELVPLAQRLHRASAPGAPLLDTAA